MIALSRCRPRILPRKGLVTDLEQLVATAHSSELFSAPHLEADSGRFLSEHAEVLRELAERARQSARQVYFVGSRRIVGVDVLGQVPVRPGHLGAGRRGALIRADLAGTATARLGVDRVPGLLLGPHRGHAGRAAVRPQPRGAARSRWCATPALRSAPRPTPRSPTPPPVCTACRCLRSHCSPVSGAGPSDSPLADELLQAVPALPGQIGDAFRSQRERGRELAAELADSTLLYAVGAGPLLRIGLQVRADGVHGEHADSRLGDRDRPSSGTARPRCSIARTPIWLCCSAPTSHAR